MLDVAKNVLITFKGICMIVHIELKGIVLSHSLTSKQPQFNVQIFMCYPVYVLSDEVLFCIPYPINAIKTVQCSLEKFL